MTHARRHGARDARPIGARRPRGSRYAREIAIVLVVKIIALVVIWSIWFAAPARQGVDPRARRRESLLVQLPPSAPQEAAHARP